MGYKMNWYKKTILAAKMFTGAEFLRKLQQDYNVKVVREGSGSKKILMNPTNNATTSLHKHVGKIVPMGTLRKMIRELGIDYKEFMNYNKPKPQEIETPPVEQDITQKIPDWKNAPWAKEQLQYVNSSYNKYKEAQQEVLASKARYEGQLQGDEYRPGGDSLSEVLLDNDSIEGEYVAILRDMAKRNDWESIAQYTQKLKNEGHSKVRIDSMLTRSMHGIKF
jgi:hypothetical protein